MSRGGYRPGAGRKAGSIDKKPRKQSEQQTEQREEAAKIRKMLSFDTMAKRKFYQEYLTRVNNKDKEGKPLGLKPLSVSEKKHMDKLAVELSADLTDDEKVEAIIENLDPLTYMLKVMNDPKEDKELRARMAQAAAPYMHPRKGEGIGKKEDKQDRAKQAGEGKFKAGRAPLKVVK